MFSLLLALEMGFNWSLRFEMILHVFASLQSRRWKRIYRKFRTCFECHYNHLPSFKPSQSQLSFFSLSLVRSVQNWSVFFTADQPLSVKSSQIKQGETIPIIPNVLGYWMYCDKLKSKMDEIYHLQHFIQCYSVPVSIFCSSQYWFAHCLTFDLYSILLWLYIRIHT